MAKTWEDLLDESRVILQDTDEPYRYTDVALRAVLNRGLQELARLRPDAFYELFDRDDVIVPEVALTDSDPVDDEDDPQPEELETVAVTDDFILPMQFYAPLVYWVAGSAELVDDEFTVDGRAATLLAQFRNMVAAL